LPWTEKNIHKCENNHNFAVLPDILKSNTNTKKIVCYSGKHQWGKRELHIGYWWESQRERDH
jgi:hypothetical protein